jgi:hypothetical protein
VDPWRKDGALHMLGSLAGLLLKKQPYKQQMEQLLVEFVFPAFSSDHDHLQSRACWVFQQFCNSKFDWENILGQAITLTRHSLLSDVELPVKVIDRRCLQFLNDLMIL